MVKPRALKPGDTIGIVSPASPIDPEKLAKGQRVVEDAGFRVKRFPHVLDADHYLAGSDRDRAADLQAAFQDDEVDAIWCSRGGYGCARLLPHLDLDAMAAANKLFLGFSDITTIHLALNRRGLPTIHAPMALSLSVPREPYVAASFLNVLQGADPIPAEAPRAEVAPPAHHTGDGLPPTEPPPREPQQAPDDGSWQNDSDAYLNPNQNARADEFLDQARRAEPRITDAMERIAEKAPGSELTGLEHRLKTEDSFKEKLSNAIQEDPGRSVIAHIADMKDSVRYTLQSAEGTYVQNVTRAIDSLLSDGYEPIKFKNSWGQPGYQGINSFWRDPETGHIFEVQFHTPESFDAKMSTHPLYEEARLPSTSAERATEVSRMQEEIFGAVPRPVGSPDIDLPGGAGSP